MSPSCANSHDRDETCPSCEPGRVPAPERPGPPAPRARSLDHVRRLREQLAATPDPPDISLDPDDPPSGQGAAQ